MTRLAFKTCPFLALDVPEGVMTMMINRQMKVKHACFVEQARVQVKDRTKITALAEGQLAHDLQTVLMQEASHREIIRLYSM